MKKKSKRKIKSKKKNVKKKSLRKKIKIPLIPKNEELNIVTKDKIQNTEIVRNSENIESSILNSVYTESKPVIPNIPQDLDVEKTKFNLKVEDQNLKSNSKIKDRLLSTMENKEMPILVSQQNEQSQIINSERQPTEKKSYILLGSITVLFLFSLALNYFWYEKNKELNQRIVEKNSVMISETANKDRVISENTLLKSSLNEKELEINRLSKLNEENNLLQNQSKEIKALSDSGKYIITQINSEYKKSPKQLLSQQTLKLKSLYQLFLAMDKNLAKSSNDCLVIEKEKILKNCQTKFPKVKVSLVNKVKKLTVNNSQIEKNVFVCEDVTTKQELDISNIGEIDLKNSCKK